MYFKWKTSRARLFIAKYWVVYFYLIYFLDTIGTRVYLMAASVGGRLLNQCCMMHFKKPTQSKKSSSIGLASNLIEFSCDMRINREEQTNRSSREILLFYLQLIALYIVHLIEPKESHSEFLFDDSILRAPSTALNLSTDRLTFNGGSIVSVASCAGPDRRTKQVVLNGYPTTACNDTRVLELARDKHVNIVCYFWLAERSCIAILLLLVLFIVLIIVCLTRCKYTHTQIKSNMPKWAECFFRFLRFSGVWAERYAWP